MSNNYSQNLTFSLVNLFARENEKNVASYSLLYKGLSEADRANNNCYIVLSNISETSALEIPEGTVIKVYWSQILTLLDDEKSLKWTPNNGWTIEFQTQRNQRYWKLKANSRIVIGRKSELTFEVTGIKASPASVPSALSSDSSKDMESLLFGLFLLNDSSGASAETRFSSFVALKKLDHSKDADTLPINVSFIKPGSPGAPNEWNVSQNQLEFFHPNKADDEVYCNTNTITGWIESRLGFSICNPSGSSLYRKSANADPRFVVSVAYGDNVRALVRMQDISPDDRLFDDGPSGVNDAQTTDLMSSLTSAKGRSTDLIKLFNDGIDTSGTAFTVTESDSAGIKIWTLRPPQDQDIVLKNEQTLRWVFNGIRPDDNIGSAMIIIAYYDIRGYKDGYLIMRPKKVRPRPCLISPPPGKPLDVVFNNPNKGINLSWHFFGVDQISILHKRDGNQIHKTVGLQAIATNCAIKAKDENLWRDQELVVDLDAGDGSTISYTIAKVKCEVPFSLDMRKMVYRSSWSQLTAPITQIQFIDEYEEYGWNWGSDQIRARYTKAIRRPLMFGQPYCRFSVRYEGGSWILSLEIWGPNHLIPPVSLTKVRGQYPDYRQEKFKVALGRREPRVGGGRFPLEDISFFGDDGTAQFKVRVNHQATLDEKTSQLFPTTVEGRCWMSSGDLVFDDSIFKKLTFNPDSGATPFEPYCLFPSTPYSANTPLQAGVERPQPLPKYQGILSSFSQNLFDNYDRYDTCREAVEVALQIHGGYDGTQTGILHLTPGFDSQLPESNVLSSRSIEPQDFHDQTLHGHDFHSAVLDHANFDGADLQGANLVNVSLMGASLQGAKLVMVDATCASFLQSNLEAAQLNYAKFEMASFELANLSGASFIGANLTAALFIGANLKEANFDGALVEGAVFDTTCGLPAEQLEALRQRGAMVVAPPDSRFVPDDHNPGPDSEAMA